MIWNPVVLCALLGVFLSRKCDAIKCFDCSSTNNSACLDVNLQRMNAIIPIVDCAKTMPEVIKKQFFCRKMVQTILHVDKSPEVRVLRGCGWVKSHRECYKNDNKDHLETVCQCFGDMCNAATSQRLTLTVAAVCGVAALLSWTRVFS